jgi:hypothetical protein
MITESLEALYACIACNAVMESTRLHACNKPESLEGRLLTPRFILCRDPAESCMHHHGAGERCMFRPLACGKMQLLP